MHLRVQQCTAGVANAPFWPDNTKLEICSSGGQALGGQAFIPSCAVYIRIPRSSPTPMFSSSKPLHQGGACTHAAL